MAMFPGAMAAVAVLSDVIVMLRQHNLVRLVPRSAEGPALATRWRLMLARGIVAVVAGCFAFGYPGLYLGYDIPLGVPIATTGTLASLVTVYCMIDCVLGFWTSRVVDGGLRSPLGIEAVASLAIGTFLFVFICRGLNDVGGLASHPFGLLYGIPTLDEVPHRVEPIVTLRGWIWLPAVWSIVRGTVLLWTGYRLNYAYGRWLIGLAGLVSLAWGALLRLYATPEPSALLSWFGVYWLLFGATTIAFSQRLRAPRTEVLDPFAGRIYLRDVGHLIFRGTEFVAAGALAALVIAVLYVLVAAMQRETIDISPITVPNWAERQGFTPVVAAQRLKDAINRIVLDADSSMPGPRYAPEGPGITINEVGLQPEAIARWLGTWLGLRHRRDIQGELTITDCKLDLHMRFNGDLLPGPEPQPLPADACLGLSYVDLGKVTDLFEAPAGEILLRTDPYLVAEACEPSAEPRAREIIRSMKAGHAPHRWGHDVAWAWEYAALHSDLHEAEEKNRTAINIAPEFTIARSSYYETLVSEAGEAEESKDAGNKDKAMTFMERAKDALWEAVYRDPRNPDLRQGLAEWMYDDEWTLLADRFHDSRWAQGHDEKVLAADQYRLSVALAQDAIGRDPTDTWGPVLAGIGLYRLALVDMAPNKSMARNKSIARNRSAEASDELAQALSILRQAVELNPHRRAAHEGLGLALYSVFRDCPIEAGRWRGEKCPQLAAARWHLATAQLLDPHSHVWHDDINEIGRVFISLERTFPNVQGDQRLTPNCPGEPQSGDENAQMKGALP